MSNRQFVKFLKPVIIALVAGVLVGWTLVPIKSMAVACQRFEVDELNNIYLMFDDHLEIIRQQRGDALRTSHLEYGPNYQLDVSNPLKPFLFYPDQGLFLAMDNTLSVNGAAVRLPEMGYEQIEMVVGSQGDHYWMWDGIQSELIRVDQHFRMKNRSGNLAARLGRMVRPVYIEEDGESVYLLTADGLAVELDLFGAFRRSFPIAIGQGRAVEMRIRDGRLIYPQGTQLVQQHLLSGETDYVDTPWQDQGASRWQSGRVYHLDGKQLLIFDVKP